MIDGDQMPGSSWKRVPERAPGTRQLRLALGMRGGVSLAVWIGGACAEIEALRLAGLRVDPRSEASPGREAADGVPSSFYERLLDATGYDGVQVDVLAGASAGGLNGALLASSLLYGIDFTDFRDVWIEVAGVRDLLRPRRDPESEPTSIMRGDYFLAQMEMHLSDRLERRDATRPTADYLDLHLAATVTTARPVAVTDDEADWYGEATYRAGFRFRHNRHTSDFVTGPEWHVEDDVARAVVAKLALAARSSSSFPAAFAPAEIDVERPTKAVGRRADPAAKDDLFGVFSDPSRTKAWVVDGGVLDNIPVARAIRSIAEAPADRATERWLLYLSPSPEDVTPDRPSAPGTVWERSGAPDMLWTLKAVARAAGTRESILEDMSELRAHNDLADGYHGARALLIGQVIKDTPAATAGALRAAAAQAAPLFVRDRAARVADRVRRLLEDPVDALGDDPFPEGFHPWPLHRESATAWPRPVRHRLRDLLQDATVADLEDVADATTAEDAAVLGPDPVTRTARYLIGHIGQLEQLGAADAETLGGHKHALYGLADAAALLSHMGELFWPVYLTIHRPDGEGPPSEAALTGWVRTAAAVHRTFLATAADTDQVIAERLDEAAGRAAAQATAGPLGAQLAEHFAWLRDELRRRLLSSGRTGWEATADLTAWLWGRLGDETVALSGHLRSAPRTADDPDLTAALHVLRQLEAADAVRTLVAFEIVSAPLTRIAPLPPQPIRFARLSAANPSPLKWPALFPASHRDGGSVVDVKAKLNGNELANFAAFYKRSWRANDWMWGHLDAVGTLLNVLLRVEELAPRLTASDGAAALVDEIRAIVTAPFTARQDLNDEESARWDEMFARLWQDARGRVEEELRDLATGNGTLTATREVLTARRHWEIVARELPNVLSAADADAEEATRSRGGLRAWLRRKWVGRGGPQPTQARNVGTVPREDLRIPEAFIEELATYRVGRATIVDELSTDQLTRLAGDTALASLAALRYAQRNRGGLLLGLSEKVLAALSWLLVNVPPTRRLFRLGPRRTPPR